MSVKSNRGRETVLTGMVITAGSNMIEKWVIKIQVDGKLRPVGELLYTEDIL